MHLSSFWQVIYGDTDSIMINSGLDDIAKTKPIAGKVIQEVRLWLSIPCISLRSLLHFALCKI